MTLSDLSLRDLSRRLRGPGLFFACGPFTVRVCSPLETVASGLRLLYGNHPLAEGDGFADFSFAVAPPSGLRRWIRPQARFYFDGAQPFEPLPRGHAYPLFEWALNWCIASHAHFFLIFHAAVVERGGCILALPGRPGSGKSTLCAGLVSRGWRLFSDELMLLGLEDGTVFPLARPVSLKNDSIGVIRRFAPDAVLNRPTRDTAKGTVTQMKPPAEHVRRMTEPGRPGWVIFPQYRAGVAPQLEPKTRGQAFMDLAGHSFNYGLLGLDGFDALARFVDASTCYDFAYGHLAEAVDLLGQLPVPDAEA